MLFVGICVYLILGSAEKQKLTEEIAEDSSTFASKVNGDDDDDDPTIPILNANNSKYIVLQQYKIKYSRSSVILVFSGAFL